MLKTAEEHRDPALKAWRRVAPHFRNLSAMRPSVYWFSGVGERTGVQRVDRLIGQKRAAALREALAPLGADEIREFQSLAFVNLEQANGAMRLNLIANVSVPVGIFIILNQIFPGRIGQIIDSIEPLAFFSGFGVSITFLLASMWYCYAGVHQARDLYHLTLIEASRRGAPPPSPTVDDDIPEPDVSELY